MLFIAAKYKEVFLETKKVQVIFRELFWAGSDFESGGITEDSRFSLWAQNMSATDIETRI